MENQEVQNKVTRRRKKVVVVVGVGILAVISAYGVMHMYKKIFMKGAKVGCVVGFQGTIDWLDKEFPDIKLRELYNGWEKLHPEQIVEVKF